MMNEKSTRYVSYNKTVHDLTASSYNRIHTEIYNPIEQERIADVLKATVSHISTSSRPPLVLDYGAGTGNLTKHLIAFGARVVAADVSPKSLAYMQQLFSEFGQIDTLELNGIDLANVEDNAYDAVVTYSVLHHVPNYLKIVEEFVRVVKPGGVIYIDHECTPSVWDEYADAYALYHQELNSTYKKPFLQRLIRKFLLLFSYTAWRRLTLRKLYGLNGEGDIHITKDDHIEWDKIESILKKRCEQMKQHDYLVCREVSQSPPIYEKYKDQLNDMRVVIYKKMSE